MQRGSTLAVIAVAAGVLVAGTVAAVAVVNAASGSPEPPVVTVVADPSAAPSMLPPQPSMSGVAAPVLEVSALPEVAVPQITAPAPVVIVAEEPAPATKAAPAPTKKSGTASKTAPPTVTTPTTAASAPPAPAPRRITTDEARAVVLSQVDGTFISATPLEHGGYQAIAVKVKRADGSTITGFVEVTSGVVFDWTQTAPPQDTQPAPRPASGSGGRESGEHEGGHESGEHEGGEHGDDD